MRTPNKQRSLASPRARASPRRLLSSPSPSIKKHRRPVRQEAADQAAPEAKHRGCLGVFDGITAWLDKYQLDAASKLKGCISIRDKNQRSAVASSQSGGPASVQGRQASESGDVSNVVGRVGWLLRRYPGQHLIPGVLQLTLTGGEVFVIDGVRREVSHGQAAERADTSIEMSTQTFAELLRSSSGSRTKTAIKQYFSGKLKVQGDLNLAMRFAELADIALRSYSESEA